MKQTASQGNARPLNGDKIPVFLRRTELLPGGLRPQNKNFGFFTKAMICHQDYPMKADGTHDVAA